MPSSTDVVNRALIELGSEPIVSLEPLSPTSKAARRAKLLYPMVRDEVLRSHPWNCAKARTTLAALAVAPAFGWDLAYAWPDDALRILVVAGASWPTTGWEVEGRQILTNEPAPLEVEYVQQLEDTNLWDPQLVAAVAAALALELANDLTASAGLYDRAEARAKERAAAARRSDGQEEEVVSDDEDDSWVAARFTG